MHNDNENDQLELCAATIVYTTNDDDFLRTELRNFETWKVGQREIDEDDVDDAAVLVEFDREISSSKAVGLLKKIIAEIETHGLPPTKLLLPSTLAELIVKQESKLPDKARYLFRWLLSKTSNKAGDRE